MKKKICKEDKSYNLKRECVKTFRCESRRKAKEWYTDPRKPTGIPKDGGGLRN